MHREAIRTLLAVDPRRLALVIADQRNGYPSGGFEPGSGGTAESTPTERAAMAPDSAARALADLDRTLRQLRAAAADLGHLSVMWEAAPRRAQCQHCGDPTVDRYKTYCRWCTSWLSDTGDLPTPKDIAHKQMGGRPGGRNRRVTTHA